MDIKNVVERWNVLAVVAAALCTCIGGFLIPPPTYQGETSYHFSVYLVTLLVGLWSIPISLRDSYRDLKTWLATTVLLILLSAVGYFGYQHLLSSWTFFYPPDRPSAERAVSGVTLSDSAKELTKKLTAAGEPYDPAQLVWIAGGSISAIWPNSEELEKRIAELDACYIGLCLLFASTIVSTVQATYCASQKAQS